MGESDINKVLAEALAYFMAGRWNNSTLAKASGVAEGTIRNYRSPGNRASGKTGKQPSAKLTEVAQIAEAMGLQVADLVTAATDEERGKLLLRRAAEHYQRTGVLPAWAPGPDVLASDSSSKRTGTGG